MSTFKHFKSMIFLVIIWKSCCLCLQSSTESDADEEYEDAQEMLLRPKPSFATVAEIPRRTLTATSTGSDLPFARDLTTGIGFGLSNPAGALGASTTEMGAFFDPETMKYRVYGVEYLNFSKDCGNGLTIYAGRKFQEQETYSEFDHWKCFSHVKSNFLILTQIWTHSTLVMVAKQDEKFHLTPDGYTLTAVHIWCWHFCIPGTKNMSLYPTESQIKLYDRMDGRSNNYMHEFYYFNTTEFLEKHPYLEAYIVKPPTPRSIREDTDSSVNISSSYVFILYFLFMIMNI